MTVSREQLVLGSGVDEGYVNRQEQQDLAAANCLAQAWALAEGDPEAAAGLVRSPHQRYPGNRGSSLLLFERLDPRPLGKLAALYEHKVYVQSIIWDINPFDQFGVELGKEIARNLDESADGGEFDPSTRALIERAGL